MYHNVKHQSCYKMFSRHDWYCWAWARNWYDFPFHISRRGNSHWHTFKRRWSACISFALQWLVSRFEPLSWKPLTVTGLGVPLAPLARSIIHLHRHAQIRSPPPPSSTAGQWAQVTFPLEGLWALPFAPNTCIRHKLLRPTTETQICHIL